MLQCDPATTSGRRSLLTEFVAKDFFREVRPPAAPDAAPIAARIYLVVVAASEEPLYRYLKTRFEADASTRVILDRRRRDAPTGVAGHQTTERRGPQTAEILSSQPVAIIRLTDGVGVSGATVNNTAGKGEKASMEGIEDRQRVDRWLEESQYLIGRIIPGYLDERDRVRVRVEAAEQDNERLKTELVEARREIAELRGELEFHRAERMSVAAAFNTIVDHLAALQNPVNDISRRLHSAQPVASEANV